MAVEAVYQRFLQLGRVARLWKEPFATRLKSLPLLFAATDYPVSKQLVGHSFIKTVSKACAIKVVTPKPHDSPSYLARYLYQKQKALQQQPMQKPVHATKERMGKCFFIWCLK